MVRILTYNTHFTIGLDKQPDWRRIAGVIKPVGADAAGPQEVVINHPWSPGVNAPRLWSEALAMQHVFGKTIPINNGQGEYGIAAFSPHPLAHVRTLRLPVPDSREPRIALAVRIEKPVPFTFIVTHFSYGGEYPGDEDARVRAAELITETVRRERLAPAVLVGDLNAPPDAPCLEALRREWTVCNDADPQPSFPADAPATLIDYICFYPKTAFRLSALRVLEEPMASDHRPVAAELEVG